MATETKLPSDAVRVWGNGDKNDEIKDAEQLQSLIDQQQTDTISMLMRFPHVECGLESTGRQTMGSQALARYIDAVSLERQPI